MALCLVLLLHLGTGLYWWAALHQPQHREAVPASRLVLLRLLPLSAEPPRERPIEASPPQPRRALPRTPRPESPRPAEPARQVRHVAEPGPAAVLQADAPLAAAPAASAASGVPPPRLLDTDATRRAIRQAARERSIAELAAAASEEPRQLRPEERLGQEVARSARGNCLKGEYFGGGGGLLSLPFWVIAEMRDKCQR